MFIFVSNIREVYDRWQNVKFAEKAWYLVLRSAIPTEDQTEPGNPT